MSALGLEYLPPGRAHIKDPLWSGFFPGAYSAGLRRTSKYVAQLMTVVLPVLICVIQFPVWQLPGIS